MEVARSHTTQSEPRVIDNTTCFPHSRRGLARVHIVAQAQHIHHGPWERTVGHVGAVKQLAVAKELVHGGQWGYQRNKAYGTGSEQQSPP
jgi:hypothetical protein